MRIVIVAAAAVALAGACGQSAMSDRLAPRDAMMIVFPTAVSQIGDDQAPPDERPAFRVQVKTFLLDRTPVTVAQFRAFVSATGYETDAERVGDGAVLDKAAGGWELVKGATWQKPRGPAGPTAVEDHPVTQVSWRDADAFCRAYGGRLPTEVEWERAARMGQAADGHVFKAGDPLSVSGRWRANVWQGVFPLLDEGSDGYRSTSPVGAFGAAPSGLTDMAGNAWEWTASWYVPYGSGAKSGAERVQRGGSFLCDPGFCQGFSVTARGRATPDSSHMHVGFRCAADGAAPPPRAGRLFAPTRIANTSFEGAAG